MATKVILVDTQDREIGTEFKIKAHREAKLHRAFSTFIFNSKGEMLLQQRALSKYHSGGLWTNICCGHPKPGETTLAGAKRRLKEENGIVSELREIFSFIYQVPFANGLSEHEFDHVLVGVFDGKAILNKKEAAAVKWVRQEWLEQDIREHEERYSYWLKKCYRKVIKRIRSDRTTPRPSFVRRGK